MHSILGKQEGFHFWINQNISDRFRAFTIQLKVKAVQVEDEVFYQSSFITAVDSPDKCIIDDSYLMAQRLNVPYPKEWEYASECDYRRQGNKCIMGSYSWMELIQIVVHAQEQESKRPGILGIKQIKDFWIMAHKGYSNPPGGFYGQI